MAVSRRCSCCCQRRLCRRPHSPNASPVPPPHALQPANQWTDAAACLWDAPVLPRSAGWRVCVLNPGAEIAAALSLLSRIVDCGRCIDRAFACVCVSSPAGVSVPRQLPSQRQTCVYVRSCERGQEHSGENSARCRAWQWAGGGGPLPPAPLQIPRRCNGKSAPYPRAPSSPIVRRQLSVLHECESKARIRRRPGASSRPSLVQSRREEGG